MSISDERCLGQSQVAVVSYSRKKHNHSNTHFLSCRLFLKIITWHATSDQAKLLTVVACSLIFFCDVTRMYNRHSIPLKVGKVKNPRVSFCPDIDWSLNTGCVGRTHIFFHSLIYTV